MKTKLLYFTGLDGAEASEVFTKLETIAKDLGYVTAAGPGTGKGNIAAMLTAIARNELKIVKNGPAP